jgi:hypothetical protein
VPQGGSGSDAESTITYQTREKHAKPKQLLITGDRTQNCDWRYFASYSDQSRFVGRCFIGNPRLTLVAFGNRTALDMKGVGAAAQAERSLCCRLADQNPPIRHIHGSSQNTRLCILPSTLGLHPILFAIHDPPRFVSLQPIPLFVTIACLVFVGAKR